MEHLVRGWLMGTRAKPLADIDWATRWARPLPELLRELHIEAPALLDPGPGGALSPAT